jgi:signal peptidase I
MPKKKSRSIPRPESRGVAPVVWGFARETLGVLAAVLFINSFLMASFEVPTGSMEDTVKIGDRVLVNKMIYGGSTPYTIPFTSVRIPHLRVPGLRRVARGDVIVFDWPGERDQVDKPAQTWFLKRCIGLPGDTIRISERAVYVNGEVFPNLTRMKFLRSSLPRPAGPNPYIFPRGTSFNEDHYGPIVVPHQGMKLVLDAPDYLQWEVFIRREGHTCAIREGQVLIDGKAQTAYTVNRDYVFALGDNRDNSLDSRFWGFVPLEDVIGTPVVVYWSWDPGIPVYHLVDRIRSVDLARIGMVIR